VSKRKPKANTKPRPKRTRDRPTKVRPTSRKGELTHFGKYVLRYCQYLDITPHDLSLAMGLHQNRIERACCGRSEINTELKDKAKSLLIDAVRYFPRNQKLDAEWLRDYYDIVVKHEPPNRYEWKTPRYYELLRKVGIRN